MITTILLVLLILWLLGFSLHVAGSLIHLLLVIAIVMILVRVIQGKNPFR
jgi:hypothetical protein